MAKIGGYLLLGWGILMAATSLATLFFVVLNPYADKKFGFLLGLAIGLAAMYYGHRLSRSRD